MMVSLLVAYYAALYTFVCIVRWSIARHYCQSFEFLGPRGLLEAWRLLVESEYCGLIRVLIILSTVMPFAVCLAL